ncbi:hypothetical protein LXL04_036898 [Taraxacum kok-saghyz]
MLPWEACFWKVFLDRPSAAHSLVLCVFDGFAPAAALLVLASVWLLRLAVVSSFPRFERVLVGCFYAQFFGAAKVALDGFTPASRCSFYRCPFRGLLLPVSCLLMEALCSCFGSSGVRLGFWTILPLPRFLRFVMLTGQLLFWEVFLSLSLWVLRRCG